MGEKKRREENLTEYEKFLLALQRQLTDKGKIIEAGWIGLRQVWVPFDAGEDQVKDMRWAFMAGAQHVFSVIMTIMEPGAEPTQKDLDRMSMIADELDAFAREAKQDIAMREPPKGSA